MLWTEEMLAQMLVPKLYLSLVDSPQSRGIKKRSRNIDVFSLSPLLSVMDMGQREGIIMFFITEVSKITTSPHLKIFGPAPCGRCCF